MYTPKFGTAKCHHCGTYHEGLPVEVEGGGDRDAEYLTYHVVLETQPCHADDCNVRLCECCDQFVCEGCGLAHCAEHAVVMSGEKWCPICTRDLMEQGELEGADLEAAVAALLTDQRVAREIMALSQKRLSTTVEMSIREEEYNVN